MFGLQRRAVAAAALIANHAGHDGAVVVERVKSLTGQDGFNAQTELYENLVQAGVIDPTTVVRSALQKTASVSLLLTTGAVVALAPDEHHAEA